MSVIILMMVPTTILRMMTMIIILKIQTKVPSDVMITNHLLVGMTIEVMSIPMPIRMPITLMMTITIHL